MFLKGDDISNLINLYSQKQKIVFAIFIFLSFFLMLLEILSVYLLIPLMQILTNAKFKIETTSKIFSLNFFEDPILNLVLLIFIVFTFKNLYAIVLEYYKFKFAFNLKINLTKKLFSNYLNKTMMFHYRNNSSKLIRNINDIHTIINLSKSTMLLVTEILIVIGLTSFLVLFEAKVAISSIIFLGVLSVIFYKFIQNQVAVTGRIKQKNDAIRIMHMTQSLNGIKDIKILNKENFFVNNFSFHDSLSSRAEFLHNFLLSLPKLILELILISAVILFISFVIFEEKNYSYLIITLGIFLAAAFRLMPSVTKILNCINSINFYRPVVSTLKNEILSTEDFELKKSNFIEDFEFNKSIILKDLNFKFPESKKIILKNLNIEIAKKDKIGIVGESGAGKTTLINLLLGLIPPQSGEILVDGKSIFRNLSGWRKKIGYVSQLTFLSDDSIKNNIALGAKKDEINLENINNSIINAGLENFIKNQSKGIETSVGELGEKISGGERQRIAIARSLYKNPSILILDEFTSALDNETENLILDEIFDKSGTKTIILVSHRDTTLMRCDKIFELKNSTLKIK